MAKATVFVLREAGKLPGVGPYVGIDDKGLLAMVAAKEKALIYTNQLEAITHSDKFCRQFGRLEIEDLLVSI